MFFYRFRESDTDLIYLETEKITSNNFREISLSLPAN